MVNTLDSSDNSYEAQSERTRYDGLASVVGDDFNVVQAMGGIRGLIETTIPPLLFIILYLVTNTVTAPAISSLVLAIAAIIVRLIQRIDIVPALSGFFMLVISALWALKSGQAGNYFVLGFITNAVYIVFLLASLLVRWPLMGVIIGFLRGDPLGWKNGEYAHTPEQRATRRTYWYITWLWIGLYAARLLVQVPFYLADATTALATARIIMGPFLFAFVAWVTWMMVRSLPPVPVYSDTDSDSSLSPDSQGDD